MFFKKYIFLYCSLLINLIFMLNLDGAVGWEKPVLVSFDKYINKYPDIYQDNSRTLITWTSYNNNIPSIYYVYRDTIWHKPELVTRLNNNKIVYPAITFNEGRVIITINDENNFLQLFYKNINSDETFKKITLVSNEKFNILPHIYNFNNNIFLFYQKFIDEKKFRINYLKDIKINDFSYAPETLATGTRDEYGSFFPVIRFYENKIYVMWIERVGEENFRNDVIHLKYSSENHKTWSDNIILSDNDKDAKFQDFIINEDKLYLVYYTTEYENNKYNSYVVTKIFDLNGFNLLYSNKLSLEFSDFYRLKINYFQNKFYIFWYTYIKKQSHIFSIESDDFREWTSFAQITSTGNNKLTGTISQDILSLVYESTFPKKFLIYFQEKDLQCPPPYLYSTTHKSNLWSYQNSPVFKWTEPYDISGIKGYAYLLDNEPASIPDIENLPSSFNGKSFEKLEDGIYYLHLRAIDRADNFSPTVHYKILINSTVPEPPAVFCPTHKEFISSTASSPEFYWIMKDNRPVKGYSYLLTQDEELTPDKKINTRKTNIKFPNLNEGLWYFKIRSCDPYNRWSDYSTFTISVEKMVIAVKIPEEVESRFSYIVKPGDVLSHIITKILKIQNINEWRDYEKSIGKFNYIQNLDFLKPGDIIMFPIIIARPTDTIETISRDVFGMENQTEKIVIVGDKDFLSAGDKVIIKDKYFLKTGKIPAKE